MPKLIADGWHLNNNQAWFFFGFNSGTEKSAFLLPPQATKGLQEELSKRITAYEKEFGVIDMKGFDVGVQSPIQPK